MSNRFLISVAAAMLIAGTGLAIAQGTGGGVGREGGTGSTMQQNAPPGGGAATQGRDDRMNAEPRGPMDSKSQTTGQAAAGAKMSAEQRIKIATAIRSQRVAPIADVNFATSVGTRVPPTLEFHTLPAEVATIYPQWRGYKFVVVKDEILIVDPKTYQIVAVIDA